MEYLKYYTKEEIEAKIEELKNQCVPIYDEMKPLEKELYRREQFDYVGKFFMDHRELYTMFTHVKSAKVGEFGLRDVRVDKIFIHKGIEVARNAEEYNYRYLGTECGEQEWNDAVLRAKDFMEGM